MSIKAILLLFVTLAVAVPQHAEHLGRAQIARARSDLAGRTISYDGSCGSWSGMTCPDSACCSSQGWCGSTSAHCGVGCQVGFGLCDGETVSESASTTTSTIIEATSTPVVEVTSTFAALATTSIAESVTTTTASAAALTASDLPSFQTQGAGQAPAIPHSATYVWTTSASTAATPTSSTSSVWTTTASATSTTSTATTTSSSSGLGNVYNLYLGDGTTTEGWPSQSEWVDFDTAFENNRALMLASCTQFSATNNDNDEVDNLKSALQSVASSSGVDSRFLLAIMMQESGGCVRAPTTNYGVRNPGLFQSHDGTGTCNDSGNVQNPCPMSEITQMVTDGADGTSEGDGLKQTISEAGTTDVSKYYKAARIYNSGSIASSGLLQDGVATHCYASDVANRLTGWTTAAHGCSL